MDAVEAALFQALNKFADEGPEPAAVEASINRLVYEVIVVLCARSTN
jgi:hypothetical protein